MSAAWRSAGVKVLEPIEVFEEPHLKRGYRAEHDLLRPEVQKRLIVDAKEGPANIFWIAAPCTSFCDWGLQNEGTRSFERPEGGSGGRQLKQSELDGNMLSKVAAEAFLCAPTWRLSGCRVHSSIRSVPEDVGSAAAAHHFGEARCRLRGVSHVCLQPWPGGRGRRLLPPLFPKNEAVTAAFSRRRPGVGGAHRHVPLKGARTGSQVTRCTEAGVYSADFVRTVVQTLQQALSVGGGQFQAFPSSTRPHRAGVENPQKLVGGLAPEMVGDQGSGTVSAVSFVREAAESRCREPARTCRWPNFRDCGGPGHVHGLRRPSRRAGDTQRARVAAFFWWRRRPSQGPTYFSIPHYRILFEDHPIKLERYRED